MQFRSNEYFIIYRSILLQYYEMFDKTNLSYILEPSHLSNDDNKPNYKIIILR